MSGLVVVLDASPGQESETPKRKEKAVPSSVGKEVVVPSSVGKSSKSTKSNASVSRSVRKQTDG